jgi:hypothetical protein
MPIERRDLEVQSGEDNNMIRRHNKRATSYQTDGGTDNDVLVTTTGRVWPSAHVANVVGAAGHDVIVLHNAPGISPALRLIEGRVAVAQVRPKSGLGVNRVLFDHFNRNIVEITDFWTFD